MIDKTHGGTRDLEESFTVREIDIDGVTWYRSEDIKLGLDIANDTDYNGLINRLNTVVESYRDF